jgi:5'-3' exonuclease
MGIERFFASISKGKITRRGVLLDERIKIDCNYFYVDFNSIVYTLLNSIEGELNVILCEIILKKNHYSIEIAKKWNFKLDDSSMEDFQKYFDDDLIKRELIRRVKNFIFDKIDERIITKNLETIYISFDGIPQMSKIIEQKHRRYMGYVMSRLNKKLFKKFYDGLPEVRKTYENNKKFIDRLNILTGRKDGVMKKIYSEFISSEMKNKFKSKYKALKRYVVSSPLVYGEAEKKIMEDVMEQKKEGKYIIFSPDADLIILGSILQNLLLMKNVKAKINILRHVQQENLYAFIDLQTFLNNIVKFAKKYITSEFDEIKICNDLIFLFTLFGNDFVPKIESMEVKNNMETLIIKYCETFNKHKYITYGEDKLEMNFNILIEFFKNLKNIEKKLLRESYLASTYLNYNYYKNKVFNEEFLIDSLRGYIKTINNNIDSKYKKHVKVIGLKLKLEKFETISDDGKISRYHNENIKNSLPHPDMKVTEYDINSYMLDRKMGLYEKKLKIDTHEIGKTNLKLIDSKYKLVGKKIPNNLDDIYLGKNKDKIIKKYVKGLFWVFNFYFNKNNKSENRKYIPIWFYKGHVAPSLGGIYKFMKKNKDNLNKYFKNVIDDKNLVEIKDYMNEIEHYLYVMPLEVQKEVPSKYDEIRKNKVLFPNLDEIVDDIWNDVEPKRIDCTYALFTNKCQLTTVQNVKFKTYIKSFLELRSKNEVPINGSDDVFTYSPK